MKKPKPPSKKQLADCRKLYLKYGGRSHKRIEAEMLEQGWKAFHMRLLNNSRGWIGWIERYGWAEMLTEEQKKRLPRFNPKRYAFRIWLKQTTPDWNWDWKYQKLLYKKLNPYALCKCKRLMIFLPPRHGKSELITVRFAAWMLETNSALNIILGSYNQKLANRFSRKIKRIVRSAQSAKSLLPAGKEHAEARTQNKVLDTREEWETEQGGGVRAVGVGGGVTGFGAGLIIIDDPVKSRAEAESETYRENVWGWFNDDIYTRLEPNAAIILIQTK